MSDNSDEESDWKFFKLGIISSLITFVGYFIWRLIIYPLLTFYRLRRWLRSERDYIHDFSFSGVPPLFFQFDVHTSESDDPDMEITFDITRPPVRIKADYEFEADRLATMIGRAEKDPTPPPYDEIETIEQLIETVLASTPGVHNYVNYEGEYCDFEQARKLEMEYRIYPDGLTQHELMNGIVNMLNALVYVQRILSSYEERLEEGR